VSDAHQLYQEGRLGAAIDALNAQVKSRPTDINLRGFLAELLCFMGNSERTDLLLDQMVGLDSSLGVPLALFRQLIRADVARRQFYDEGRLPELLGPPPPWVSASLEASIHVRDKKTAEAMKLLSAAEEKRPPISGTRDGASFDDMRDLDDLVGAAFEVYTTNGKFYWIPMERVIEVEFRPPQRPRDLLWRHAHMVVRDGPEGDVYIPALYHSSATAEDESLRLGRSTDWIGGEGEPTRGVGQRTFLIGEEAVPILDIQSLRFGSDAG
jgi:type VI secretion system protein ImpE